MADEPTPSDAPETEPEPVVEPPEAPAPELGDAGKAAIKAERQRAAKAEREAKELKARLEALEAESLSETERKIAEARREASTEAIAAANARIIRAEIKAAAAGKLADPSDAIRLLDLTEFDVSDDGEVDNQAIESAIDSLVAAKPYLTATGRPAGTGGGGARPATAPPSVEQQIADLEAKGDHRAARSLKNRGLAAALLNPT